MTNGQLVKNAEYRYRYSYFNEFLLNIVTEPSALMPQKIFQPELVRLCRYYAFQ